MSEWTIRTIGQLCTRVTSGGTPSRKRPEFYSPADYPWVKTGDLTDAYITEYSEFISKTGVVESSAKLLPAETVLMAMYGATVGKLGMLREPATCNQAACAMIVDPEMSSSRWLFYSLLNERDRMVALANGAAQQNLSGSTIKNFEVLAPPLSEQRAIAEILGAIDDKIAANTKLAATAHELAAHIYGQAIRPLGVVPMSSVLSPVLGGTPPRSRDEYWDGDQMWASAKDITGAEFATVVDTDEKISMSAVQETKAKPLPVGSVILTARGTVGAVARLATPSSFNQSCYGFIPGKVTPGVLYFSILDATQRAKAIAHGSVFDTITMKTFDHLEFPNFIEDTMALAESNIIPLLDLVTGAVVENQTLAATRDALLPQLMSGMLRVKDSEAFVSA